MTEKIWRENFSMVPGSVDYKPIWYQPGGIPEYAHKVGMVTALSDVFMIFADRGLRAYIPVNQIDDYVAEVMQKILHEPNWVKNLHRESIAYNEDYFKYCQTVEKLSLPKLSNAELVRVNSEVVARQINSHEYPLPTTWFLDSNGETFTKYVVEKVRQALPKALELEPTYTFSLLSTPTKRSLINQEEIDWLQLAVEAAQSAAEQNFFIGADDKFIDFQDKLPRSLLHKIQTHHKKWRWLPYGYVGPAYDIGHYLNELRSLMVSKIDAAELLADAEGRLERIGKKQTNLLEQVSLPADIMYLLNTAKEIIWIKDYRKACLYYGCFILDTIHREVAKRLSLSLAQVNCMTADELDNAVRFGSGDEALLNDRLKYSVLVFQNGRFEILVGEAAKQLVAAQKFEAIDESDTGLTGTCACPGAARGAVKIVNTPNQMSKMHKGDIMVAHTTFPSLLPAMKLAAAIVTEDGGVTCHAAIVARELNIPCVVGVKRITHILSDGDAVEVDAVAGKVTKLTQ